MFYAVRKGKIPGIYKTWPECQKNTNGFSGAEFHKFKTLEEAKKYMNDTVSLIQSENHFKNDGTDELRYPLAFVDGSYNPKTKVYGYGGVIQWFDLNNKLCDYNISGFDDNKELSNMRNITGELMGAITAIKYAIKLNLKEINIYYDYIGIEKWGNGLWNSNKTYVQEYKKFISDSRKNININFIKVSAHTGVELNEKVDKLAKKAVGIL